MNYYHYLIWIALLIVLVFILQRFTTMEFVSHAKLLFKTWSVWLASIGSALSAWVQSFPSASMDAWQALPEDVKSFLPHNFLGFIGAFMVAMAVIAQFVRQKKLLVQKQTIDQQTAPEVKKP